MTLELNATPEEVMRAVQTLEEFARGQGVPDQFIFGLSLALEECGSNIVNHALQRDARRKFQVVLGHSHGTFTIELRDPGPPFDPTKARIGKLRAQDDDLPGGWGIELVRRYTDEIHYARESDKNVLRLTKRLGVANRAK